MGFVESNKTLKSLEPNALNAYCPTKHQQPETELRLTCTRLYLFMYVFAFFSLSVNDCCKLSASVTRGMQSFTFD